MSELSGWYYDQQIDYNGPGRMTCITLHPNTECNDQIEWTYVSGDKDNPKYRDKPICTALIGEDFNLSIANTWSDFGGDPISQIWESIRPLAPYAGYVESGIRRMNKNYRDAMANGKITRENKLSSFFGNMMLKLEEEIGIGDKTKPSGISKYLNRTLVTQGTRFSYYSGTGISFGNMVLKFTIMPTWYGGGIISVQDQVKEIYPYTVGHLMKNEKKGKDPDNLINWQLAPGGFEADYRDVDNIQNGTLLMKFGALYAIENLVIESANFTYSKQAFKYGNVKDYGPLFCEVTLQLRPATKFSDIKLKEFVDNVQALNVEHNNISSKLKSPI